MIWEVNQRGDGLAGPVAMAQLAVVGTSEGVYSTKVSEDERVLGTTCHLNGLSGSGFFVGRR